MFSSTCTLHIVHTLRFYFVFAQGMGLSLENLPSPCSTPPPSAWLTLALATVITLKQSYSWQRAAFSSLVITHSLQTRG